MTESVELDAPKREDHAADVVLRSSQSDYLPKGSQIGRQIGWPSVSGAYNAGDIDALTMGFGGRHKQHAHYHDDSHLALA